MLVPDVAAWRRERMPRLPNTAAFSMVPDWVCEVVSPPTAIVDRGRKVAIYAREGVGHLWIVDPILRTVEVYRLEGERWIVATAHGGSAPLVAEGLDAVTLDPGRWWLDVEPDPTE